MGEGSEPVVRDSPRSMTGFARSFTESEGTRLDIELRSVNHRFLDVSFKLPKGYSILESAIRDTISKSVQRGRIEVLISKTLKNVVKSEIDMKYAKDLLEKYISLCVQFGLPTTGASELLARFVLSSNVDNSSSAGECSEVEKTAVLLLVNRACQDLVKMRAVEGDRLVLHLKELLQELREIRGSIAEDAISSPSRIKDRLLARVSLLANDIKLDESRLAVEVAFLADRTDISEEIERLQSHFSQLAAGLELSNQGRRLDFLLQECGREFNTIGSKAQDASIQQRVVTAKVALEKMREQVQNLE